MRRRPLLAASTLALAWGAPAHAQVVERNLPPQPQSRGEVPAPANILPADQDDTPIGPALAGIVLLGPTDAVAANPGAGIDTSRVARLRDPEAARLLETHIGRPLSRRLIAEIQADIARFYRHRGFPFVSLSTPEQEVTSGVLQLRVIEFVAADIEVTGASATPEAYVRSRIRQQQGEPIDIRLLAQDIDWLNRNPFRGVEAIFSPGDELGNSNLTLVVDEEPRRWRVYGGVSNNGTESTGWTRLFAGAQASPFRGSPDTLLSYQYTTSDDLFSGDPSRYASHAGIANVAIAPRQQLDLTVNHVATRQQIGPFGVRLTTMEASAGWQGGTALLADLRLGVEARRSKRSVDFGGVGVSEAEADIVQLYAGLDHVQNDRRGRSLFGVTLHVSPGGIGGRNDDESLAAYTGGRVTNASYAYADAAVTRLTRLGRARFDVELIGRLATGPLPDTEQTGIGGQGLVRGYALDDGGYDSGIIMRNTLRAPPFPLRTGSRYDALQPYLFADGGYARQLGTGEDVTAISAGAGATLRVGRYLSGNLDVAHAFNSAPYTREGDWRVHLRFVISY